MDNKEKKEILKYENVKLIDSFDFDNLVSRVYGRPYCFQQQNGCKDRGIVRFTVPADDREDDEMEESIPEVINGDEIGVKFDSWLKRDPKQLLNPTKEDMENNPYYFQGSKLFKDGEHDLMLFWERSFYPCLQSVVNDLHKRGIIEAGEYIINIDW